MYRWYAIIALSIALCGALALEHWKTQRLKAKAAEVTNLKESLRSERENTRKANEASERYQARYAALELEHVSQPFPVIRMCRNRVQAPGAASIGSHESAPADDEGTASVSPDIGPAADLYGTQCEATRIQLEELQRWVRERK